MRDYTVLAVARSGAEHAVCLADATGGFHVARATARIPRVGAKLLGSAPRLGFGLLRGVPIDEVFRVIFERVHCSRDEAHSSLHGRLHP